MHFKEGLSFLLNSKKLIITELLNKLGTKAGLGGQTPGKPRVEKPAYLLYLTT